MSFDQWIALLGLVVSTISLAVTITGGILAILGYRKIIKSTDENAKERQVALDRAADTLQEMGQNLIGNIKRDKYMITGFMLIIFFAVLWIMDKVRKLEKESK